MNVGLAQYQKLAHEEDSGGLYKETTTLKRTRGEFSRPYKVRANPYNS